MSEAAMLLGISDRFWRSVQYARRVVWCSCITFVGIVVRGGKPRCQEPHNPHPCRFSQIVSLFPSLWIRLAGISLASFSSGLGEMTFLQLSTAYRSPALGGKAVGWFSSGTGAAGLVGALIWWLVRGLGVELGLGLTAVIPPCMCLAYFLLLPGPSSFQTIEYAPARTSEVDDNVDADEDDDDGDIPSEAHPLASRQLTAKLMTREKLALARPLVLPYMIPLFAVYFGEMAFEADYPIPACLKG
jgi:battenin